MSELINYKVKFNNTIYNVGVKADDSVRVFKAKVYSYTKIPPWRQQYPALLSTVYKWNDDCKIQQLLINPNFTLEVVDKSPLPATDINKSISHQETIALPVADSGAKDTGGLIKPQTVLSGNKPECKSMFSKLVTDTKSASKPLQTTTKLMVCDDPQFSSKGLIMDSSQSLSHPEVITKNLQISDKQFTVAIKKTAKLESKSKTSASKEMTLLFTSAEKPLLDTKQQSSSDKQSVQVQALEQFKAPILASFDPGEPTFRFSVPLNRAPAKSTKPSSTEAVTKTIVPIITIKSQKTKAKLKCKSKKKILKAARQSTDLSVADKKSVSGGSKTLTSTKDLKKHPKAQIKPCRVTSQSGDQSQAKPTIAQPLKDMKKPRGTEKFAPSTSKHLPCTEVPSKSLKKSKKQTKSQKPKLTYTTSSKTKLILGKGPKCVADPTVREKRASGSHKLLSYTKVFSESLKHPAKKVTGATGPGNASIKVTRVSKVVTTLSTDDKPATTGKLEKVKKATRDEKCISGDIQQPSYIEVLSKSLKSPGKLHKDTKGSFDASAAAAKISKVKITPLMDDKATLAGKHGAVKKVIKAEKCALGDREQPSYTEVSSKSLRGLEKLYKDTKGSLDASAITTKMSKVKITPLIDDKVTPAGKHGAVKKVINIEKCALGDSEQPSYMEVLSKSLRSLEKPYKYTKGSLDVSAITAKITPSMDDKATPAGKHGAVKKLTKAEKCALGDREQPSYTEVSSKSLRGLEKPYKDTKGSFDASAITAKMSKVKITPLIDDKATLAGKHGAVKKVSKADKCASGDREHPSYTEVFSKSLRRLGKPYKDATASPDVSLKGIGLTKDEKTPAFDNKPTSSNLASVSVAEGIQQLSYPKIPLKSLGSDKPKSSDKPE